jgi:hypothetical protein
MRKLSRTALAIIIDYKLHRYVAILLISGIIEIIQQYEQFIVIIFRRAHSIQMNEHKLYISYVCRTAMPEKMHAGRLFLVRPPNFPGRETLCR